MARRDIDYMRRFDLEIGWDEVEAVSETMLTFGYLQKNSPKSLWVGFDGKQSYLFNIEQETKKEILSYQVSLVKQGAREELGQLCDLEQFLVNNGFKEIKTK